MRQAPILFHAAWNASTFLMVAAAGGGSAPPPETSGLALVAPLLFVLPNLLYGLLVVAVVLAAPGGIMGGLADLRRRLSRKGSPSA